MPKMIRFGTDPAHYPDGAFVNFTDWKGASWMLAPGSIVPVAIISHPQAQEFVAAGLATLEGEDDGGDGNFYAFRRELAGLCGKHGILHGDPSAWSLNEMISAIRAAKATDDAAIAAFTAAEPTVTAPQAMSVPPDAGEVQPPK